MLTVMTRLTAAELIQRVRRVDAAARRDFRGGEIAQTEQQVVNAIHRSRMVGGVELLRLRFHFGKRIGVEQLAQLDVPQQLAKLRLVDRQRLRAALGERGIAVVDVIGDVPKEQGGREWRRYRRIHGHRLDLPLLDAPKRFDERRHVEHVAEALAIGLEQHRERSEPRRHGKKIRRALSLLPQRAAAAWPPLRQKQRPRRRFPELRGKERGAAKLTNHERLDLVG